MFLLRAELALVARHSFSVPYGSFNFEDLQVIDDTNLQLTFYENDCRQITVTAKKMGLLGSHININQL